MVGLFEQLEEAATDLLGWHLDDFFVRRGMMQLPPEEGGGMVEVEMEDMQDEDERGEYAPVIVEL